MCVYSLKPLGECRWNDGSMIPEIDAAFSYLLRVPACNRDVHMQVCAGASVHTYAAVCADMPAKLKHAAGSRFYWLIK